MTNHSSSPEPFGSTPGHDNDFAHSPDDPSFDGDGEPAFGAAIDGTQTDGVKTSESSTPKQRKSRVRGRTSAQRRRSRTRSDDDGGDSPADPESNAEPEADAGGQESGTSTRRRPSRRRRTSRAGKSSGAGDDRSDDDGRVDDGRAEDARAEDARAEDARAEDARAEDDSAESSARSDDDASGGSTRRRSSRRKPRSRSAGDEPSSRPAAKDDTMGFGDDDDRSNTGAVAERDDQEGAGDEGTATKRRRRRGTRGGRRRRKKSPAADAAAVVLGVDAIPGEDDDLGDDGFASDDRSHRAVVAPKRGRGSKKRVAGDEGSGHKTSARRVHADGEQSESKSKKKRRRGKRAGSEEDKPGKKAAASRTTKVVDVPRDQRILVNAHDPEETRVVVVQDERIVDLQMTVNRHKSFVNDIYRGRVVNLETNIGAAFVDFGQGRNGFLHLSDVMDFYGDDDFSLDHLLEARTDEEEWDNREGGKVDADIDKDDEEADDDGASKSRSKKKKKTKSTKSSKKKQVQKRRGRTKRAISDLLQKGQLVVAQITKDAIGDKGPTLTTFISIPGRYLVLMPSLQRTGVSRKIEDDRERRRLKRILQGLDIPDNMGVIVRTAGIGKTKAEIKRDLDYLLAVWGQFSQKLVLGRAPAPLYQESDVAIRTMRDLFSSRTEEVLVDDEHVYEKMREFTEKLMPEHLDRIKLHDGSRPLFHAFGVEQDFEKIFSRRVELPSGGSIVIDQTEALVAIDVNSGRTRDEGADFEDIALKTNLEAVPEIARQIKLRDMGGILVLDFIDMMRGSSRKAVEKALRDCLAEDRARSKVGRISQFGLLELTRQRLGPGLSKLLYEPCSACRGSGRRRTAQSRAQALLRRLASALSQKGFTKIEILAHPDTVDWIFQHDRDALRELEDRSKRELVFKKVEDQTEDSIFHYLRADGREVRPGGRRKR